MTWSLSHTISYVDNGSNHTALGYLFDTALPALSTWTTGAHPDASSYKRVMTRTTTTLYGGGAYSEYFWANWSSTSPTTLSMYEDATYTSSPGDLATDTTNQYSGNLTSGLNTESWKFWTSDENSNALLVTRGKSIMFWEPGYTGAALMEDSTWDGSSDSKRTQIFPGLRSGYLQGTGRPQTTSATTTSEFSWVTLVSSQSGTGYVEDRIDMNVPFGWTGSTTSLSTGAGTGLLFYGVGDDVGWYRSNTSASSERYWQSSSYQGNLWLVGSRYYLSPWYQGTAYNQMMFDFGTSEPDFT